VECILIAKQTNRIGKQYLVKWKRCHPKKSKWVKPVHLDHLPKMVEKFEQEHGHELAIRKVHKDKFNILA
jgi:hypothetical protein